MTLLAVGLSHRSAPLPVLERAALAAADPGLPAALLAGASLDDVVVVATCNRVEVYADARRFHGGVSDVAGELARRSGVELGVLSGHLYAHHDTAAVEHLLEVAAGLDSMAVGESQILGQVRASWRAARADDGPQDGGTGRLDDLFRHALRTGRRAQSESGLDRAANGLVEHALDRAEGVLGRRPERVVVVGAGAMAAVVVAGLAARPAPAALTVVSRSAEAGARLAAAAGHGARAAAREALPALLAGADLVVCCTGSVGHVLEGREVAAARTSGAPLVLVDLALPRDVDPLAEAVAGVTVLDLDRLGTELSAAGADGAASAHAAQLAQARRIVAEEVARWRADRAADDVAPTVVALRGRAATILDAELERLRRRLPDLPPEAATEVEHAVRRVVDKVLHTPTVRVQQLADAPGGSLYAEALRALFDLDVSDVASGEDALAPTREVVA